MHNPMPNMYWKRGGVGLGPAKNVDQKRPKSIFPFVNFIFPHYEIRVQGGGGGV